MSSSPSRKVQTSAAEHTFSELPNSNGFQSIFRGLDNCSEYTYYGLPNPNKIRRAGHLRVSISRVNYRSRTSTQTRKPGHQHPDHPHRKTWLSTTRQPEFTDFIQIINIPNADVTMSINIVIPELSHQSTFYDHSQVPDNFQIVNIGNASVTRKTNIIILDHPHLSISNDHQQVPDQLQIIVYTSHQPHEYKSLTIRYHYIIVPN